MERCHNKIAVVTGASAGIGAATCRALTEKGMIVIGLARRLEKMESQVRPTISQEFQHNFHCHKCDVSLEESVKNAFVWIEEKFGGVDVLINNAGIAQVASLVDQNNSEIVKSVLNTNVLGAVWCAREAFQIMKRRSFNGHIVLIGSTCGHAVPNIPGMSLNIYAPSKYAIKAMTEVLRQEFLLHQTKVKITSISPGPVRTDFGGDLDVAMEVAFLAAEDIADAIVYCLQTPPHVQIHDMVIKPIGDIF